MEYTYRAIAGVLSVACVFLIAVAVASDLNIDYSHTVKGSGTVVTDYRMGDEESSEATGSVRGTGDVSDEYALSMNGSSLLTVENNFVLTKNPEPELPEPAKSYPSWPESPVEFRLTGTKWAEAVELSGPEEKNASEDASEPKAQAPVSVTDASSLTALKINSSWSDENTTDKRSLKAEL
jgi:hypothetical protein